MRAIASAGSDRDRGDDADDGAVLPPPPQSPPKLPMDHKAALFAMLLALVAHNLNRTFYIGTIGIQLELIGDTNGEVRLRCPLSSHTPLLSVPSPV